MIPSNLTPMDELLRDIATRAEVTPSLPAVRIGAHMVTYAELDDAIGSYGEVLDRHGLSHNAALAAALTHSLPELARISDVERRTEVLGDVVEWLSRHLPPDAERAYAAG